MSSRPMPIRQPSKTIEPSPEPDLASLVVMFWGPPPFYQRSTGPRPADRREILEVMPELMNSDVVPGAPSGELRRVVPGAPRAIRGGSDRRRAARDLRDYVRASELLRRAEERFDVAATAAALRTASGTTPRAERLEVVFERQLDAHSKAERRAISAIRSLGGPVRSGGRIFVIARSLDADRPMVVVVEGVMDLDELA